ncbi:MAG: choline-sulfatase [Rhodobacterales bacterium]|nr:choline-sulfatase [Rhodobacterales bacterium]
MTRRNILVIMVDQLTGTLFPDGPVDWLHVPHLRALAARSTRYANAYCPSPLCAPARASFMTGQLPSRTGVFDNAAELPAATPTFAHYLRAAGYQTALAGKMHFVGPDQLHGFEERLTTDIYPADFGWTPDYRKPGERIDWWYHNMGSVKGAGVAEITNQLEYDDAVAFQATAKLYDLARGHDPRPWCLTVSFTHPHDPFVARRKYWDLYEDCAHLLPETGAIPYAAHDPHSRRLMDACDWQGLDLTEDDIRRSRRAYFANISYIDGKIGEILAVMDATRQDATVLFLADHGEMLGELGLWFKMSFREGSARVPLMIASPTMAPGLVTTPVSTLSVAPTLAALAGATPPDADARALTEALPGLPVRMEYAAEGTVAPMVSLVHDLDGTQWKLILCPADPPQLFNLTQDPRERTNRADTDAKPFAALMALAHQYWPDLPAFDAAVRASQSRRLTVYEALRKGSYAPWDHEPRQDASSHFMRNHMDLNIVETAQRFPRGE